MKQVKRISNEYSFNCITGVKDGRKRKKEDLVSIGCTIVQETLVTSLLH